MVNLEILILDHENFGLIYAKLKDSLHLDKVKNTSFF